MSSSPSTIASTTMQFVNHAALSDYFLFTISSSSRRMEVATSISF
jgi:hypothetical protein